MDIKPVESENIYLWLHGVCTKITTNEHIGPASQLLKIAKKNKRISTSQYYDLYMVLYEKVICGTNA